jgi:hypothetical protein
MKITLDGIPNIRDGLVAGLALRNATRKHGTIRHKHAILIRLDHHSEFHVVSIPTQTVFRNGEAIKCPNTTS